MRRALAIMLLAGCYEGTSAGQQGGDASASGSDDGSAGESDDESAGESGGDVACEAELAPVFMRRLSHAEYRNTIEDLLGEGLPDPTASFPPEAVIGGFDNNRETSEISDVLVERYRDAAEQVVAAVLDDPARRDAVLPCDDEDPACAEQIVREFGRRAWRRPLEDDELARLVELASSPADPDDALGGARVVLEALLQSPNFLYRIEVGTADPEAPSRRRLTGFEVASRLSYLVLASAPPDALLDAADAGALDEADGIEAAARELLADPRAPERLGNFYAQWLDLRRLDDAARDEYPAWSDALRSSMHGEIDRLLREHLLGGGDVLDVLTTEYAWVDAELAALYGLPAPASGFEAVATTPAHERGGLLTTAAILTVTGRAGVTTPIIRGRFMREALLCDVLPPPPPDVPVVPDPVPGESERERLDRHRSDPACAGCHTLLEPLGYGLARYDAIGALRGQDDDGQPVSAKGSFDGGEEPDFDGALQLQALLRDDPQVAGCLVRHLHRYAFGRVEDDVDACTIEGLSLAFGEAGRSFEELVVALVRSDAFRHREDDGP